ncbi:UNVERIFIED_CONTAM: hypothetical protein NY100_07370 [Prevotella sp. 15_C9]
MAVKAVKKAWFLLSVLHSFRLLSRAKKRNEMNHLSITPKVSVMGTIVMFVLALKIQFTGWKRVMGLFCGRTAQTVALIVAWAC